MVKIYLDAGHGGKDPGAVGNDLHEADVVLALTNRVNEELKAYKNVETLLTRNTDVYLSLSERTDKANQWGADCFISFHLNSSENIAARGFETFIYNGEVSEKTIALQNVLHAELIKKIGNDISSDRGKKRANFHVLRESDMSAVLIENLFVSNKLDAKLLKNKEFMDKLVEGYLNGLEKFFGLERTIRPPTNENDQATPKTGKLWQVVSGVYAEYENAIERQAELKKDGYESFLQEKE